MNHPEREDGVPAQGFLDDSVYVDEILPVVEVGQTTRSNDGIQLYTSLLLYFRMQRHRKEEAFRG